MRLALLVLALAACTASMPPTEPILALADPIDDPAELPLPAPSDAGERDLAATVQPRPGPNAPPLPLQIVPGARPRTIGQAGDDEVEWLSRDARFAVIARHSGRARTCPGGPVRGARSLHDTTTGATERIDRIVARDPRGRHIVVHSGKRLWLLDATTGARQPLVDRGPLLDGADPCSVHRRAAFDTFGTRLVYLRGEQAVVRTLATGDELVVDLAPLPGQVWRAEVAATDGWLRAFTSTSEHGRARFPAAPTDCEGGTCMAPGRRGASVQGDRTISHTIELGGAMQHITGDGEQRDFGVTPLGAGMFGRLTGSAAPLVDAQLRPLPLPEGCYSAWVRDGVPALLLHCGGNMRLWWPQADRGVVLPGGDLLEPAVHRDAAANLWLAARHAVDGEIQLLRIDATRGDAFAGPRVLLQHGPLYTEKDLSRPDRDGWLLLNSRAGVFAYDLATGDARVLSGVLADQLQPGAAQLHGRWHALDAAGARLHALPGEPAVVAENGCALVAAGRDRGVGPWTLHCPQ